MKRIIFIAVMILSLSACDNTKIQLRAPLPDKTNDKIVAGKTDTVSTDTTKTITKY